MERVYPVSALERAMKVHEVLLRAIDGRIKWIEAADILDVTPRTILNWRQRLEEHGVAGLIDRRSGSPSPRRAPYTDVEEVLRLYREEYPGFNVKHFHEKLVEDHGLSYSYTWTKNLLQTAGAVSRAKRRKTHRIRRERRVLFGQMLHLDGSEHAWLSLRPGERQVLLLVVDDATGRNLSARLVDAEATWTCLDVMRDVVEHFGIPAQLYTDRHSVYWVSKRGGGVDRERLTQFGRAMDQLGVEMIPAGSPQARGRGERWNGTWQGRLVAELARARIDHIDDANRYIREVFLPDMNRRFAKPPAEEGGAFVGIGGANLDDIFCLIHASRTVAKDNTVRVNRVVMQIEKSPWRPTFAGATVDVYEYRDGSYAIRWNRRVVGRFTADGQNRDRCRGASGLSLRKVEEENGRKQAALAPSPTVVRTLGSLPSVALSSRTTRKP